MDAFECCKHGGGRGRGKRARLLPQATQRATAMPWPAAAAGCTLLCSTPLQAVSRGAPANFGPQTSHRVQLRLGFAAAACRLGVAASGRGRVGAGGWLFLWAWLRHHCRRWSGGKWCGAKWGGWGEWGHGASHWTDGQHLGRCGQQAVRRRACTSQAPVLLHGGSPLNPPVGVKSWMAGRVKGMPPCSASMQRC